MCLCVKFSCFFAPVWLSYSVSSFEGSRGIAKAPKSLLGGGRGKVRREGGREEGRESDCLCFPDSLGNLIGYP